MRFVRSMLIVSLLISVSLVGCISEEGTSVIIDPESLIEVDEPCFQGSTAISQSMTEITVNGESRLFRLSAPSSDAGVELPIIIAFHGGGGAAEDFATYRYLVGVGQTLADMKDRFHQEYVEMIKQETGE